MTAKIGRYRVLSELGEGGFGKVYLAVDPTLNSRRAIKVLSAPHDPDLRIRFKNEAVAAASLNHPSIVTIFEYGEENDRPYIVMEYLEGKDLSKRLASGPPMSLFQKIAILQQVASGLHAAHSHSSKIIHRDIKPANVMLLPDGTAKIMDFGIARLAGEARTRLTGTNIMIGSVSYMAPEQFNSGISDALSDIWSFGVLAYELLAESHPFPGSDVTQVMYRITSSEPAQLHQVLPGLPSELGQIVSKSMCKTRAERYQSLEDVVFDLDPLRINLRRTEADQLLLGAKHLHASGQLDAALKVVREALDVDNQFKTAREFREKLQVEVQKRAVQERIGTGLREVSEALGRDDLDTAVRELETVCGLAPEDPLLAGRLQELKASQERRRQAEQLLKAAEQHLIASNLEHAAKLLDKAVELDPSAPSIVAIRKLLLQEQSSQKQRAEVARIVRESERQASARNYGAAIQLIAEGLESYPSDATLLESSKQYAESARQEHAGLENVRAAIGQYLEQGEFARAKSLCLESIRRYPSYEGFQTLLTRIKDAEDAAERAREQQQAAIQRKHEIQKLLIEVRRALAMHRLDEAAARAEEGANRFPEESEFRSLLESMSSVTSERAADTQSGQLPVTPASPRELEEPVSVSADQKELPPRRTSKPIWWIALAGLAVVAAIVLFSWMKFNRPSSDENAQFQNWSVSPTTLEFVVTPGMTPEAKLITVRPQLDLSIQAPEWIILDQSKVYDATVLSVGIRTEKLPPGLVNGSLLLRLPAGSAQPISVRVVQSASAAKPPVDAKESQSNSTRIATPGWIRADKSEIDLGSGNGDIPVTVTSNGPPREFSLVPDNDWIAISSRSARTPASLRVTARAEQLAPGVHVGTISLQPRDSDLSASTIQVRLNKPAPDISKAKEVVVPPTPAPIAQPPVPKVVRLNQKWTGGLDGEMRIRRPLRPGEALEITAATPGVDGLADFPWLYDTKVQVRVISPPTVVVETQPRRDNDWSLIRLRAGPQPVQLIILGWQISP